MTAPEDGLERALRRALAAAVSQVEPGADALSRIRARTQGHQPQPWLVSVAAGAVGQARNWVWRGHWAWTWPAALPRPRFLVLPPAGTKSPAPRHRAPARKPGLVWLRPAAVLAGVAFIASIALAVPPFRQAIVQVSSTMLTGQPSGQAGGSGGGSPAGSGTRPGGSGSSGGTAPTTANSGTSPGAATKPRCGPSATPTPTASPVVSVNGAVNTASAAAQAPAGSAPTGLPTSVAPYLSTSPTACASPSPTASPTQSPSLSPSPTISNSPSASPSTSESPTQSASPTSSPTGSPTATPSPSPSSPAATPSGTSGSSSNQGLPAASGGSLAAYRAWPGRRCHPHGRPDRLMAQDAGTKHDETDGKVLNLCHKSSGE